MDATATTCLCLLLGLWFWCGACNGTTLLIKVKAREELCHHYTKMCMSSLVWVFFLYWHSLGRIFDPESLGNTITPGQGFQTVIFQWLGQRPLWFSKARPLAWPHFIILQTIESCLFCFNVSCCQSDSSPVSLLLLVFACRVGSF